MRAYACVHLNLLSRYDSQFVFVEYCTMITRALSCLIILSGSFRRTKPVFVCSTLTLFLSPISTLEHYCFPSMG